MDTSGYVVSHVTSKDGTRIGYRRYGSGPAIILVQAAMGTMPDYHELAQALAPDFTVFVPERRGRPLSPCAYDADHVVENEIEDVRAMFDRLGARSLFGLSSGAAIALEAAHVLPTLNKLVLYEAPLYVPPRAMRFDLVTRFNRELDAGAVGPAMVTALITSGFMPHAVQIVPRRLLDAAASIALRLDNRRKARTYPPLRELVPTMQFDFGFVSNVQNRFEAAASVTCDVLLLSCKKSPAYIQESACALARVLPRSRRIEFDTLTHSGPWNADRGGKPKTVAATIRDFITTRNSCGE